MHACPACWSPCMHARPVGPHACMPGLVDALVALGVAHAMMGVKDAVGAGRSTWAEAQPPRKPKPESETETGSQPP